MIANIFVVFPTRFLVFLMTSTGLYPTNDPHTLHVVRIIRPSFVGVSTKLRGSEHIESGSNSECSVYSGMVMLDFL
jgi:hypothetical protein